jgi:hypothetical protein
MNRNTSAYIDFLNTIDWSVFHRSEPATWVDPFWKNNQISGNIADLLTWDAMDTQLSGLDVYDPAFEEDLNTFTDGSGTTEDYGFTTSGQAIPDASVSSGSTSQSELLDLIKARELAK